MTQLLKYLLERKIPHQTYETNNELIVELKINSVRCIFKQSKDYPNNTWTRVGGYEAKNQSQRYMTRLIGKLLRGDEIN